MAAQLSRGSPEPTRLGRGRRRPAKAVAAFVAAGCIQGAWKSASSSRICENADDSRRLNLAGITKTPIQAWAQADGFLIEPDRSSCSLIDLIDSSLALALEFFSFNNLREFRPGALIAGARRKPWRQMLYLLAVRGAAFSCSCSCILSAANWWLLQDARRPARCKTGRNPVNCRPRKPTVCPDHTEPPRSSFGRFALSSFPLDFSSARSQHEPLCECRLRH